MPIRQLCTLLLSIACWLGAATVAHADVDAITTASYDLKLAFTVAGQIDQLPVKAGDHVKAGQLLMGLDDKEGEALILQYTLKAESDLGVRQAKEQLHLAQVEEKAIRELRTGHASSPIEVERAQAEAALAALDVEKAEQDIREAKQQLAQAAARHQRYFLRAPIDGVVDTILVRPGETVESLKPVVRLVSTDPLYVDASVPTAQTLKVKGGDPAWVSTKLPGHLRPIQGKVLHLAQVADPASDTRVVRVEIPNPENLPAGGAVSVTFVRPSEASASATPAAGDKP